MFSPRPLALSAGLLLVLVSCSALPTDPPLKQVTITEVDLDDPWFGFPFFSKIFAPIFKYFPSFDLGPRIVAEDDRFRIEFRVKDFTKDDIKVKVKNGMILIQGAHESKPAEHDLFASHFFHTYPLPGNASAADVRAELSSDGWLTVSGLKSGSKSGSPDRDEPERLVPVEETGAPHAPPSTPQAVPVAPTASAAPAADDRREPTTQPPQEATTGKENTIPHGTDDAGTETLI